MKTIVAVFPRGSKKRKSINHDKHDHGQEKRRPLTFVEGKKHLLRYVWTVKISCIASRDPPSKKKKMI